MAEEHNRLDSQFNVVGAFWAPETIGTVRKGTGSKPRKQQSTPISGKELFLLSQKMRALLRGVLLLHLGLPEAQFSNLLEREATRYH